MKKLLPCLIAISALLTSPSCNANEQIRTSEATVTPLSPNTQVSITWPSDPTQVVTDSEELKRAWARFESSQPYRLAKPSDRTLSPEARARVNSNNPGQIVPFLYWWGVRDLVSSNHKNVLVVIVVDPNRSDPNRYGLVVFAAPKSVSQSYKTYWVAREEDMESYLISPASGSVFLEFFRRNGSNQTKELAWDRKSRRFKLI